MSLSAALVKRSIGAAVLAAGAAVPFGVGDSLSELLDLAYFARAPEVSMLALTWERTHCLDCEAPRAEARRGEARGAATARR